MVPHSSADLPRDQRILVRDVVADQQNRIRLINIRHGGLRFSSRGPQDSREPRVISSSMMVDVIGPQSRPRKPVQQVIFFVRGVIRADYANRICAVLLADLF